MTTGLSEEHFEQAYEFIAAGIDAVGQENESRFLSKLCLTLAHKLDDIQQVQEAIDTAKANLIGQP